MVDIYSEKSGKIQEENEEYEDQKDDTNVETQNHNFNFYISEDGIKQITQADYHTRFRSILWTSNINEELPIKLSKEGYGSEVPLTISTNFFK